MTTLRHNTFGNPVSPGFAWSDPLWIMPGVRPSVSPPTYAPSTLGTSYNPPGTGTTYPTPANTVAGIATQWCNWARYYRDQYAILGVTFDTWTLCPYYIGGYSGGLHQPVFGHASDAVTGGGSAALLGPLYSSGLTLGAAQARTAFTTLAPLLAAQGIEAPSFIHDDNEKGPSVLDVLRPWLLDGADNGWAPPMISGAEARAATDAMFDARPFSTLWASRLRGDGVTSISLTQSVRIQDNPNRPAFYWFEDFAIRLRDRAHRDMIAAPARESFPNILVGNWGLSARARNTVAPMDYAWTAPEYTFVSGLDYLTLDAYPIADSALAGGVADIPNWLTALDLDDAGSHLANLRAISITLFKRRLDSVIATGALAIGKKVIVWLPSTDYTVSVSGMTGQLTLTLDNIRDMALYAVARGVLDYWHFWNDIIGLSAQGRADLVTLIAAMNAAAPDEPAVTDPPPRYNTRTQRMLERQRDHWGRPVTFIDVATGDINATTGKRAITETETTILAVRRPVNQGSVVTVAQFMILASDLTAAGLTAKEDQRLRDDAGARYVVTRVNTENDRLAVVLQCAAG